MEELSNSMSPTRLVLDHKFPYPPSYTCIAMSSIHHIKYVTQMDRSKLLFSANTTDDERICIKFVCCYSKDVHEFCSSKGFAPKLKGFQKLPGGWHMIVMEMIGEDYCCLMEYPTRYPHYDDIMKKLTSLHQESYVHGDVRNTNIMVKVDGSQGFKLLDFDWSGKIGEARYPMNVYRGKCLWRPHEAEDGRLIKADHDIEMLKAISK